MEGGKLVCREIYAMNDAASGILNPVKMYKYSYDTALSPENAAAIPCRQVLGSYVVRWERAEEPSVQGS